MVCLFHTPFVMCCSILKFSFRGSFLGIPFFTVGAASLKIFLKSDGFREELNIYKYAGDLEINIIGM